MSNVSTPPGVGGSGLKITRCLHLEQILGFSSSQAEASPHPPTPRPTSSWQAWLGGCGGGRRAGLGGSPGSHMCPRAERTHTRPHGEAPEGISGHTRQAGPGGSARGHSANVGHWVGAAGRGGGWREEAEAPPGFPFLLIFLGPCLQLGSPWGVQRTGGKAGGPAKGGRRKTREPGQAPRGRLSAILRPARCCVASGKPCPSLGLQEKNKTPNALALAWGQKNGLHVSLAWGGRDTHLHSAVPQFPLPQKVDVEL